jgi:hypothetical protein
LGTGVFGNQVTTFSPVVSPEPLRYVAMTMGSNSSGHAFGKLNYALGFSGKLYEAGENDWAAYDTSSLGGGNYNIGSWTPIPFFGVAQ